MADIIDILIDDHANMRALTGLLEREVDRLEGGLHADVDTIAAISEYLLEYPDRFHHPVEDALLERLRERDAIPAGAASSIAHEHETIADMARAFDRAARAVAGEETVRRDAFVRLAQDFIAQLRRHLDMEEERLFPLARKILDEAERAALAVRVPELDDPLFGGATRARYRRLGEALLGS
jgi:hemerythrin-like domain-containing protein